MPAHRTVLSVSLLGFLAAVATSTDAGDSSNAKKKRITASDCERLIKQLVNPDKPPFEKAFVLRLPKGVNEQTLRKKQAKITAAYQTLSDNIEISLPLLVKNVDDRRFSFVYTSTSGAITTTSVGGAVQDIIFAHVEVYRRHATLRGFGDVPRCPSFIRQCGGIEKWWKSRRSKPLAELQLEGIEWLLRQKKPEEIEDPDEDWAAAKRSVEKMAKDIRKSKRPIRIEHRSPALIEYK